MYHSDGYVAWLWLLRAQADGDEWGSHLVRSVLLNLDMSHSQMLGKVESGGGPIFKVVLEC